MLKIGPLAFDLPVVQAALSGYSDGPMRLITRRFGAPYALHEAVLDQSIVQSAKARQKLLGCLDPQDHPVGGQLLGAEPGMMAQAAAILVDSGYDVVDVNFGCPVKKVLGRRRGGFLLSTPATAAEILRAIRASVAPQVPLTVKMRRGLDDSPQSERDFFRILDAALELGVDAVTVHARTVKQRYVGPSRWDFLTRVKRHAGRTTILGSGDLWSAHDIRRMLEETGVDGVTVARGCIGNPWIFQDARALLSGRPLPEPPTVVEQGRVIREHFDLAVTVHGPRLAARIMRKFGIKYAELHPFTRQVRDAFVQATGPQQWLAVLDSWYDPGRDWPPGRRKTGPGRLVAAGATP